MTEPKYVNVPYVYLSDEARKTLEKASYVWASGMTITLSKYTYAIAGTLCIHTDYLTDWEHTLPVDEDQSKHWRACYLAKGAYEFLRDSGFICETSGNLNNEEDEIYYIKNTFMSKEERKKCRLFKTETDDYLPKIVRNEANLEEAYKYMRNGYKFTMEEGHVTCANGTKLMIINPKYIKNGKDHNVWHPVLSITI
jgi:hypothetical protein